MVETYLFHLSKKKNNSRSYDYEIVFFLFRKTVKSLIYMRVREYYTEYSFQTALMIC